MSKETEVKKNAMLQKVLQISHVQLAEDYLTTVASWQNAIVKQEIMATMINIQNPNHCIFSLENDFFGPEQIKKIKTNVEKGTFDIIFKNIGFK